MNEQDCYRTRLKGVRVKRIFLPVAILVATSPLAFGQTSRNHTSRTGNDEEARRQVLATDDRRMEALRQANPAPLRQIYADDYTLVTPSGVIRSKDEQINDLVSGRVRYGKIETTERIVRVYGDVAIVLSREKYDILQAGQQVGGDIFFTRTYKKFGAKWREIAAQGTFVKQ
jgi:ketosteroid isomerase-like protein